jgi:hypothetical protein
MKRGGQLLLHDRILFFRAREQDKLIGGHSRALARR